MIVDQGNHRNNLLAIFSINLRPQVDEHDPNDSLNIILNGRLK
jgi:hypothetical protein